jgi:hypothetical protein
MPSPIFRLQRQVHQYQREEEARLTRLIRLLGVGIVLALGFIITSVVLAAPASQPIVAASQPVAQNVQQWWMPLLAPVLAALGTLIAAVVAALLKKLVALIEEKYKLEVPAEIEKLLADKAKQLIASAEEEAERRILHEDGTVTSGADKSKKVVTALMAFAESLGYGKQYQEEQIKKLVDGVLHLGRIGSENVVGSNGERGKLLAKAHHTGASQR